jgi:hypothetical protein
MTRSAFLESLAWELTLRRVPCARQDLERFVEDAWPLIEENPDVGFWAREYQDRQRDQTEYA